MSEVDWLVIVGRVVIAFVNLTGSEPRAGFRLDFSFSSLILLLDLVLTTDCSGFQGKQTGYERVATNRLKTKDSRLARDVGADSNS